MAKKSKRGRKSASTVWAAFEAAEREIHDLESRLHEARKSARTLYAAIHKRVAQFAHAVGEAVHTSGHETGNGRTGRGTMAVSITAALGKAKKPMSVDEIQKTIGAKSKPSVSQTLMKMVHTGKLQRFTADGKAIPKGDKSQRARGYGLA